MKSIVQTVGAIERGACSAEEVIRDCFHRIRKTDPSIQATLTLFEERSIQRAKEIDRRNPLRSLTGVPIIVKDNICTSFGTTTCGSKILRDFHSQYNAHTVDRLEQAGAIIIGKANLDEFAMGSSTENSAFQVTKNPWDQSRVAGGSSGGSVAAVAARMVPGALGSDTGGSVRQPASFCGVVGLKPTYGRVSRFGLVAYGSSLDQVGPVATTALDVAWLLGIIAGYDPRDSTSVNISAPWYAQAGSEGLERPLNGIRIGISDEYFGEGLNDEVRRAVESAIAEMKQRGATTVPIHLRHTKYAIACYYLIATAEASSNLARFDGVHYGYRTPNPKDVFDMYAASRGEGFGTEVKRRIMLGTYALSSGYYDAYYLKALKVRTLIKQDFDEAFEKVDVIASPVAPTTAYKIGEKTKDPLTMYLGDIYTISANLAGICAISLPCGFDSKNLPIGLQLMGPAFGEQRLLSIAHQYQQTTDHHTKSPAIATA